MRTKAFTLIESLLTLVIVLLPLYVFKVPHPYPSKVFMNQSFINQYIHQQYLSIFKHQKQTVDIHDLHQTFSISFNQKGYVSRSANLQLTSHEQIIHISFITGRIYESVP